MSQGRAIVIGFVVIVAVLAGWRLYGQLSLGEQVQVDFTLKLQNSTGDEDYRAKYHWGANEIDSTTTSSNVCWTDRDALAQLLSSGDLTTAVKGVFSIATISSDTFSINEQGDWTLFLKKKVCDGVYVNLNAAGDTDSIKSMTPSLTIDFIPSILSSALQGIGLDSLDVIVTIRLHIMGEIVELFLQNCYEVLLDCLLLSMEIADWVVGTIWVS
ncbi:MAG: hypothetical protein ACFFER_19350 [Candidatus Thorarchaeota archaeon]